VDAALTSLAGSPLLLVALFALVVGDAFLVVLPGETAVVAAAALSASAGEPVPLPVLVVAALGAVTGDSLLWLLGRRIGLDRWRWQRRPRPAAAIRRARAAILRRPALLIFTARYVPFARIAVNLVAGAGGMPLRRFLPLAVGAGIAWAVFNTVVGTVAGTLLQDQPLLAVAASVAVAITLGLAVDGVASAVGRRRGGRGDGAARAEVHGEHAADLVDSGDMTTAPPSPPGIRIQLDSPRAADVQQLLDEHMADMLSTSPPESVHALSASELARPGISFWTARDESGALLGTGAVKDLGDGTGEIKSMRTVGAARGRGIGAALLERILDEARGRGWSGLYLETGTQDEFAAARRLYERYGFRETGPFGSYGIDPNSTYFVLELAD
jgi:membrane protein DedA with SNARE-associated domain/GNAT superfamily N-acetyltransferase